MFKFIINLFKKKGSDKSKKKEEDLSKKPSSVVHQNNGRFLKLTNEECALVLHENNQCEVVFTIRKGENQDFTPNEELLMALAIFLKQPGFGEMLISEFHKAAMKNPKMFSDQEENNNPKENGV